MASASKYFLEDLRENSQQKISSKDKVIQQIWNLHTDSALVTLWSVRDCRSGEAEVPFDCVIHV